MKFVIDPRGSVIEHRSAESEDLRFDFSWELFLCPTLVTRRKSSSLYFSAEIKLTICLILLISDHAFTVLANSTVISTHLVFLMRDQFGTCQSTMFDTLKFIDRRFYQAVRGVDYS